MVFLDLLNFDRNRQNIKFYPVWMNLNCRHLIRIRNEHKRRECEPLIKTVETYQPAVLQCTHAVVRKINEESRETVGNQLIFTWVPSGTKYYGTKPDVMWPEVFFEAVIEFHQIASVKLEPSKTKWFRVQENWVPKKYFQTGSISCSTMLQKI